MQPVLALSARTDPVPTPDTRIENCRLRPWQWWGLTSWSAGRESPIALSIPGDDVIASSPCGCLSPSCVNQPAQPRAWQQACRERAEQATHPDHGSLDIEQLPGVDLRRRVRRLALSALIPPSHARPAERKHHRPSARAPGSMLAAVGWVGCLPSAHALLGPRDGVVLVRGHLRRSQRRVEVCLLGHLTEHARCELRPEAGHGG